MIQHYVEFCYPSILVCDTEERQVSHREAKRIRLPKRAFGFRFFDVEVVMEDGEELRGKRKNVSGWCFAGRMMTIGHVLQEMPDETTLISNMRSNGYDRIVKTRFGQCIPLHKGDVVLAESPEGEADDTPTPADMEAIRAAEAKSQEARP